MEKSSEKIYKDYLLCELNKIYSKDPPQGINESMHLSKKVIELGYHEMKIEKKEDIEKILNKLIEVILEEFIEKYIDNKEYILFTLYNYKKINSVALMSNMYTVNGEEIKGNSEFLLELSKIFKKIDTDSEEFYIAFKNAERFVSSEKIGIEILLEALIDTSKPVVDSDPMSISDMLTDCIRYSRDIGILLLVKNISVSNLVKNTVSFDENGLLGKHYSEKDLIVIDKLNYNNVKWLKDKEDEQFIVPNKLLDSLGEISKLRTGLNLEEINALVDTIIKEDDSWIIVSIADVKEYFSQRVKISDDDTCKLLKLLVKEPIPYEVNNYIDIRRDSRLTLKPIESSTLDWTSPMREVIVKSMKVGDFIMSRTRRTFTPEFKLQMVRLFENGKSKAEIVREYDLTASALDKWVKNHQNTGSFNHIDNLSEEARELRRLRKDIQQLKMENDILKQAALIMGRK